MRCIIVSGRSGSGKSITLRLLEDLGFYCVDNLPISLLPALEAQIHQPLENVAVSIDARNISVDIVRFKEILKLVKRPTRNWEIIYLDADEATLLKRFSETRRKHPLTNAQTSLGEAIQAEKEMLEPIASMADITIDTRHLNMHQLRHTLVERLIDKKQGQMAILFQSFGFKYGLPLDTDFVFDSRTLPNPYWDPTLREFSGLDEPIIKFLNQQPKVQQMVGDLTRFLNTWIPQVAQDHRHYLTISIGCTGGKHRSVYLTESLAHHFNQSGEYQIQCRHRDLH